MKINNKIAIVTGGGTGVGRATSLKLASKGCSVLVNYSRSNKEAEQTARECQQLGVWAEPFQGDISNDEDCQAMVSTVEKKYGKLDILVNNAGNTVAVPHHNLGGISRDDWDRILGVNVIGTFQMTRAAEKALKASGSGEVVMVSSIAGIKPSGSSIAYCASKAAVNSLTQTLAKVFAPQVRINAVCPGFITGRWQQSMQGDRYEQTVESIVKATPLQKAANPEDIADAILSIIEGSDMMTGQCIMIEGGAFL
ncbi:MAG: SDR family oxidoreductase [SAR324 cluster bacterium]|nr:SDR family oxidoreductase [SAR324 cluster bacterium]